ncbi:hypothetical protein HPB50_025428 [Hyalomma asiaticum]|uniref:Uncharacterized protein n=1 Tax=Hyalomma asiaticum TaxID=266040 RepID=A0ACB7SLD1_HYAAI|nr:hypothetical protein HPB50_025428 [Hyalomma asiaticum]
MGSSHYLDNERSGLDALFVASDGSLYLTTGAVRLAYTLHESDDAASASALPPIVALDGLFGRRENLAKACKALAAATGRNVFAVDLRNHGDSPPSEDMDYTLTTSDLELFLQDRGLCRAAFVGHSMGGRVAMKFALTKDLRSPVFGGQILAVQGASDQVCSCRHERLVVVDIAPSALPPALTTEWLPWQINAMKRILSLLSPDMSFDQALDVADQYLSRQVTKPYVRSFLLANLRKGPRAYEWQLNLKDIERNIPALADPHYLDNERSNIDTLFIASDGSIYITNEDLKDIKRTFPNSRVVTIKGSTHWLYNDKTEEFVDLVYAVDARNHGDSPHVPDMDYALMAADVELFMRDHQITRAAFIGHSMGGRTAMRLALKTPSLVERMVVVDVGPSSVPAIVGDYLIPQQLDAMDAVLPKLPPDLGFDEAHREADRLLAGRATLENPSMRSLLLSNLRRNGNRYEWSVNVNSVRTNIGKLVRAEDLKGLTSDVEALFLCGGLSPYVPSAEHGAIRRAFPKARIVTVEGAGHWVHRDRPAAFLSFVKDFMAQHE